MNHQTVEMYVHKAGFDPYREPMATHSRRRYRLIPNAHEDFRGADPSLWIIHYSRSNPQDHVPAHKEHFALQNHIIAQRKFWAQQGLIRKEFMLHDRANWPTINLPPGHLSRHASQSIGYPGNVISHMNRTQQQRFLQQQQQAASQKALVGPPANKRMRLDPNAPTHPGQRHAMPNPATGVTHDASAIDDDEDTTRGDIMDYLTPRDISTVRYMQHHEWMEEIFHSPYSTTQIVPGELGLGRKGELEDLTRDFFNATTSATPSSGDQVPRVGRLGAGRAEDFTKRATDKLAEINAEMEKMKRQHAKRMAKLSKGAIIRDAERTLRSAPMAAAGAGTNGFGLDRSAQSSANDGTPDSLQQKSVNQIAAEVEVLVGKSIAPIKEVTCIQKGGLEDNPEFTDMDGQEYDMVNQLTTINGQTDGSHDLLSTEKDPIEPTIPSPQPLLGDTIVDASKSNEAYLDTDVNMTDISKIIESKDQDSGDWVMVSKDNDAGGSTSDEIGLLGNLPDISLSAQSETGGAANELNTPGDTLQGFTPNAQGVSEEDFGATEFGDSIDFGNLDTAGEALSSYGADSQNLGLDEQGGLGLDESAFADGFNPSPQPPSEG